MARVGFSGFSHQVAHGRHEQHGPSVDEYADTEDVSGAGSTAERVWLPLQVPC